MDNFRERVGERKRVLRKQTKKDQYSPLESQLYISVSPFDSKSPLKFSHNDIIQEEKEHFTSDEADEIDIPEEKSPNVTIKTF